MCGYALFAYRVNWCILSAYVRDLCRLCVDLPKLSGLYNNYGYNNYIAIRLYSTIFAIKDAFSKTIIVLFGILCYGLLFVVGCFLFATTTAGGLLRWCSIVPGGFLASSARRCIGSRCCPWLICAGGKVAAVQDFNSCN